MSITQIASHSKSWQISPASKRSISLPISTPRPASISNLLSVVFGAELDVKNCDAKELNGQQIATFVNDEDQLVALCACDKQFVAYSGAALSMIPAAIANEMISGNTVTDAMVDNFYEVMNICSKSLMSDTSTHLRLDRALQPTESADAIATLGESANVTAFDVGIPQYGNGTLTFVIT